MNHFSKKNHPQRLFQTFFIVSIFFMTACDNQKITTSFTSTRKSSINGFNAVTSTITEILSPSNELIEKNKAQKTSLTACLSVDEKMDLEYFLRDLIFENGGGFVLFGHKPLCEFSLHNTGAKIDQTAFQKWFESLPQKERNLIEAVRSKAQPLLKPERNPFQGWLALQKVTRSLSMKNHLFIATPSSGEKLFLKNQGHYELMFVNIQETALILAENYEIFKKASGGIDFHPLQAVFELQNSDSVFWKNIFAMHNHLAKGLLFGFGRRNSLFGSWHFASRNGELLLPSENYREEIEDYLKTAPFALSTTLVQSSKKSPFNLTIPLFGVVPGDATPEKYAKEKAIVEKIYLGKDIVEVTLQHLTGL